MYPVTADYLLAIQSTDRITKITGLITLSDESTITVTNDIIAAGSLYVSEQSVSGEDLDIGSVYVSELGIGLISDIENPYSLDGARINLQFGIQLADDSWEYVELGTYYVYDIQRNNNTVTLKSYDGMILFDIPNTQTSGAPYSLLYAACAAAGVPLGMIEEDFQQFLNYDMTLNVPEDDKINTYRDLIMWICQLLGAFARVSRIGQLEIIKHGQTGRTIATPERLQTKISDFEVQITEVTMKVDDTDYSQGAAGMTMVLSINPLLADQSSSDINTALENILSTIGAVTYVPFNADIIGDPALQPGDYVIIEDAAGGDVETLITHSTWRYRGRHNLKAVGKNARLRSEYSQVNKAIDAVLNTANEALSTATVAQLGNELLNSAIGGNILIRQESEGRNEILIMDSTDKDHAIRIWRYNINGWGYSSDGVGADDPSRTYSIMATMDGTLTATQVVAAVGTFMELIAGNASAQHMRLGLVDGDPVFEIYGNDGTTGTGVEMSKDRMRFMPNVTIRKYDIGTRQGLAFFVED